MPRRRSRASLLVLLALLGCGCSLAAKKTPTPAARIDGQQLARTPAPPDERYYLLLFGSQDRTRRPAYTHTWATLVRAIQTPGGTDPALEIHTISWLPVGLDINPLSLRVEPGRNVELHETVANARRTGQEVAMWGPYEVWHGFAYRFLTQKMFLESGMVGYQCVDNVGEAARDGNGCDCIHAITDMDPVYPRWRYPLALYGQPATANLVRRIMHSPVTIEGWQTHDWLIPQLRLDQYEIERRSYRGKIVPWKPGTPGDLNVVRSAPLPAAPLAPKDPTPKTAPDPSGVPPVKDKGNGKKR